MTPEILQKIGFTNNQATAYLYLLQSGSATAPDVARQLSENRTNAYMLCDRLVELGLADKRSEKGKNRYYPANPAKLTGLVETRRKSILEADSQLKTALPQMISAYFAHSEQPGVQFFEGKDGLTKIYEDHLRTKSDIYLLRTPADETALGDILYKYMGKRAKLGIKTHMLGPYSDGSAEWANEHDQELNRDVAWFPPDSYTAPVEISTYGDKVSLISFGKETIGTIVESPQIAEAFRQAFDLMKAGAMAQLPDKNKPDSVE